MDECERRRLVGDAIILERAEKVLRRRDPRGVLTDATEHAVVTFLGYRAKALRLEAEDG